MTNVLFYVKLILKNSIGGKNMIDNKSESIIDNHVLNRKIVYAINKAISDDVPQEIRENRLETNNRHILQRVIT